MIDMTKGKPRRARWVWCDLAVLLVLLYYGATIGARIWWGKFASEELQAETNAIAAAGQSLDMKSLAPLDTNNARNAAILYAKAIQDPVFDERFKVAAGKPDKKTGKTVLKEKYFGELVADYIADAGRSRPAVKELLAKGAAAALLCRQARDRPDIVWQIDYSTRNLSENLPSPRDLVAMCGLLSLNAMAANDDDDTVLTAEFLLDAVNLSNAIAQISTFRHARAAADADELLFKAVREISQNYARKIWVSQTYGLTIQARAERGWKPDVEFKGRNEIEDVIRKLCDPCEIQTSFERACMGERCTLNDLIVRMRPMILNESGEGIGNVSILNRYLVNPAWDLDHARTLHDAGNLVRASYQDSYPAAMEIDLAGCAGASGIHGLKGFTHCISAPAGEAHEMMFRTHFTRMAHRRLGACLLAWRLFLLDHGGGCPENMEQLAKGRYLPGLPEDPFNLLPQPIRLVFIPGSANPGEAGMPGGPGISPETSSQPASESSAWRPGQRLGIPVIYSVYVNGKDDGGQCKFLSDGQIDYLNTPDLSVYPHGRPSK